MKPVSCLVAILGSLAFAFQPAQAGTLTIVPTFDSTITGASNAAQIEAAINSAVRYHQRSVQHPQHGHSQCLL